MKLVGINPVIVHGGGPEITSYMDRLGMPVEFYDGLRVTTDEAMEVVQDGARRQGEPGARRRDQRTRAARGGRLG